MNNQRFAKPYMLSFIALGGVALVFSIYRLPFDRLDLRFLLLMVVTITIGSRAIIKMPRFTSHISVSDTFVFLTLLLYGGEAAILLASAEAVCASYRFSKRPITFFFNTSANALSTFATVWVLRICFGSILLIPQEEFSATFITAVGVMALVQYVCNSGMVAIAGALKSGQPLWQTWRSNYLWTSVTYFAGASAAAITAKLFGEASLYTIIVVTPIIAIVFFTYQTYIKNLETSATQAEQAERHVEELNHYITEQDRIREQFTQLEKLSALGELASGVAHDFNNTLAGILGRAQLMLRTDDPEKIKRGLNLIIKSAEDGAKTVKRIQDFARQRRDHDFELVAVDQLLFDVSEITRPRWKDSAEAKSVHINLELQIRSNAFIMGDDSELREVLVNMVFNAVDAMPQGGRLTLATDEQDDCVSISVSDTGAGMSQDVRSRIFDPFFTTKGKAGLGLGLAVSYGIVSRHEGQIEVESEVGSGTIFRINLPIAKGIANMATEVDVEMEQLEAALLKETIEPAPQHLRHSRARVLVVDDEAFVRELLSDILENCGCETVTAENGRDALARFDAEEFDGVFTDIGMPGMSGWEVVQAIRERDAEIPLAVITGWGEAVGSDKQRDAQINWVVAKPFTATRISEMAQAINQRCHKSQTPKLHIAA